jgi:hypothetical protein
MELTSAKQIQYYSRFGTFIAQVFCISTLYSQHILFFLERLEYAVEHIP